MRAEVMDFYLSLSLSSVTLFGLSLQVWLLEFNSRKEYPGRRRLKLGYHQSFSHHVFFLALEKSANQLKLLKYSHLPLLISQWVIILLMVFKTRIYRGLFSLIFSKFQYSIFGCFLLKIMEIAYYFSKYLPQAPLSESPGVGEARYKCIFLRPVWDGRPSPNLPESLVVSRRYLHFYQCPQMTLQVTGACSVWNSKVWILRLAAILRQRSLSCSYKEPENNKKHKNGS